MQNSWKKSMTDDTKSTKTWKDIIRGTRTHRLNQIEEAEADKEITDFLGDHYEDNPHDGK